MKDIVMLIFSIIEIISVVVFIATIFFVIWGEYYLLCAKICLTALFTFVISAGILEAMEGGEV